MSAPLVGRSEERSDEESLFSLEFRAEVRFLATLGMTFCGVVSKLRNKSLTSAPHLSVVFSSRLSSSRRRVILSASIPMPELPEVETIVRGLQRLLPGRRILDVRLGKTDFIDDPVQLGESLPGCRIESVTRHGKFIVFALLRSNPAASATASDVASKVTSAGARMHLLVHLGMTGQLTVRPAADSAPPHTHAIFFLDDSRELRYTDIRRFGRILVVADSRIGEFRGRLGADPLEITEAEFARRMGVRHARIKALLLDQHALRGMGNIYADESLWRARIHPARRADLLTRKQLRALLREIRTVLQTAIRLRGSSVSDYVDAEGIPGRFQLRHRVYQREGKPCARCAAKIRRVIVAGRSSYFCPRCQRPPRVRKRARQSVDAIKRRR
jgi:formamidopyrimidine-DNA glycosylase